MRNTSEIQEKEFDATAAERLDQITGDTDAAFGDRDSTETIEGIISAFTILPDRQAVTIQSQEGAVVTDDKVFHLRDFCFERKPVGVFNNLFG